MVAVGEAGGDEFMVGKGRVECQGALGFPWNMMYVRQGKRCLGDSGTDDTGGRGTTYGSNAKLRLRQHCGMILRDTISVTLLPYCRVSRDKV